MSSLGDDLEAFARREASRKCKTCTILAELTPEDLESVRAAWATGNVGKATLAKALTRNGYPVGKDSIRKHIEENHEPQL